jgi:predicted nucleotidyltransferase
MQLPEKIRRPLQKLIKNLQTQENISSISLFGSWSRGDADPSSSDVDLLIVDNQPFEYEYTERIEQNGTLIDLDHIPLKWITETAAPEIDQKIHESYILYDREWKLANTKEHMMNSYYTPERYKIRTENYLLDADIYLSRATSAHARGDQESAQLFATLSAQTILKIAIEAAKLPLICSRYLETLKTATKQIDENSLFPNYLTIAGLENLNLAQAEEKLSHFKYIWDEMSTFTKTEVSSLNSVHFKIRTKLNYYTTPAFLQGMILRSQALLNETAHQEAAHYLLITLADMLENYAWLKATEQNTRLDYTTLLRFLKGQKQNPSTIYKNATHALGIENIEEKTAEKTITAAKHVVTEVRQKRKIFTDKMHQETY